MSKEEQAMSEAIRAMEQEGIEIIND